MFLYGSLMPGMDAWNRLGLSSRLRQIGLAAVRGVLFDLGRYPGLVPGEQGLAHGVVCCFCDADVLVLLDDFEACDDDRPGHDVGFRRRLVATVDGAICWSYVFVSDTAGLPIVPDGRWTNRSEW